ncbi:MAG: antibiotic biosynthesis monooxygenase [Veillonella sp.]|nr:antibiotic biosynthesis monooxygenase [Veillonella sp.]
MIIVAKHTLIPEHKEEFMTLVEEIVAKSRQEEGNVFYIHSQSVENENEYVFTECWKDQEAIDTHMATEHFTRIAKRLMEITSSFTVEVYKETL